MPIFEYSCRACSHQFEALVLGRTVPQCPRCGNADLQRELSLFAVNSEHTRQSSLNRARATSVKVETDKAIADEEYVRKHHEP